jgi:SAM-dependent methyltransferase
MEKAIRLGLFLGFSILNALLIQYLNQNMEYGIIFVVVILILYYYLIKNLKKIIKNAIIYFERIYDRIIGLDTAKIESFDEIGSAGKRGFSIYEGTKVRHIRPLFEKHLDLFSFNESIIDLGCGKGSALIAFRKAGFINVAGVEISEKLCRIAEQNLKKLNLSGVEIINSDILDFSNYDNYDIFYMFNPFPAEIIGKVIHDLEKSLQSRSREIKIIYMNPMHHEEISKSKVFKMVGEFNYDSEKSSFRKIMIYKN